MMVLWFIMYLNFNFFHSDVLGYWNDSLNWTSPFHEFHVPGYPLIIALLRLITLNSFSPLAYMLMITMACFIGSILILNQLLEATLANNKFWKFIFILLFSLWPFTGITYVVYPVADIVAIFFYMTGLYLFITKRENLGSLFWAGALITHKALWVFVLLGFLAWIFSNKSFHDKKWVLYGGIIALPIFLLWFFGAQYHQDYLWIISQNLNVELQSKSSLPIFDGLIGTLMNGGWKDLVKGVYILFLFGLNSALIFVLLRKKPLYWQYGMIIASSVLLLLVVLNQHEIWAVARFSRLLVLPIFWIFSEYLNKLKLSKQMQVVLTALLVGLYLTQIAYAYYMAIIFYA